MSTRRPLKQISALKKTRRYRDHVRQTKRKMQLERLEDRRVMTTGPTLVNVLSNYGAIANDDTIAIAPREILLRFAEGQRIDPATIANGVRVTRGGLDRTIGGTDDVLIQPGFIGLTDTTREIVVRFADNLPDDVYRIELVGTGPNALRDRQGNAVNGGVSVTHNFNLDVGAQIVAIVPQPVRRVGNGLVQDLNKIEVYFNPDLMNQASVTNPAYYKLINTTNGDVQLPTDVQYTAVPATATTPGEYKAVLTFASNIPVGTFKLKAGATDEQNNTIASAIHVGSTANPTTNFNFQSLYLGDDPNLQGVAAANDVDLYRFDLRGAVGSPVPFTATVAGTGTLNPALRVFDWQGNEIGTLSDVVGNSETISRTITINADPTRNTIYLGVSSTGNIAYNAATGQNATGGTTTGKYSLTANWAAGVPLETNGNDSSFANANNAGTLGLGGLTIPAVLAPQFYAIDWPGTSDDPGHRDLPPEPTGEEHVSGKDGVQGIQVFTYNFPTVYGTTPQGNTLFNGITETQKQRAREVFEIYGRYLGVKFIEAPETGGASIRVVTGDLRAIEPTIPTGPGGVAGLAGNGLAIMDNAEAWGNSEYGGAWFNVAMHEIGHLLGLGHSYDLPALTIQGSAETPTTTPGATNAAEPVFPGDHDILHGQTLYRPEGRDIDLYKFQLTETGRFTAETIAERLSDRAGINSSQANTVITLYRETIENGVPVRSIVSRNDDYFSSDSYLELELGPGTYYVSVTSTGMTGIDPTVVDSGFGGTTDGAYELKLNFTPATSGGMVDAQGTRLDGDLDGIAGGAYEFFFKSGTTIFVDKAKVGPGTGPLGGITNPYTNIDAALAAAEAFPVNSRPIVRIVGNGGTDGNMATLVDNLPYLVGYNDLGDALGDGFEFLVPQNVTVMIDAGAIIKLQAANIDAGTSAVNVSRAGGVIQVLGTPIHNVQLTSFSNDAIGGNTDGPTLPAAPGDWGGIVYRDDSDRESENIFLNYVNNANITYGGGKVVVNASEEVFNPIHVVTARPTVTFNRISFSADAAISANPDSFQDTLTTVEQALAAGVQISPAGLASRIGPDIYGNTVVLNSFNGLFVRVRTNFGSPVEVLTTFARFDDTDIVHMIPENLHIQGKPGGPRLVGGRIVAQTDARLRIDPGVIVKLDGTRIEATVGSQLIIEGSDALPVILTSIVDDRYGAGGTFDTSNDASGSAPAAGDWGGLMFNANSIGSIDRARIFFAGGVTPIEGSFASFNPVEIHQADVRIAKSVFQFNADGTGVGGNRSGRGSNGSATIFVRGAQPIIVDNVIRGNQGNIISINANAMTANVQADYGRSTGQVFSYNTLGDNFGPLVRLNRIVNNGTNGMEVRGGVLTTESIWDDTDIAHVLREQITILNHHTFSGLRLQSSVSESLVVKLFGQNAGFLASGVPIEITDRIGGTLHIIGQPNRPVVLTSLADDTVPAGLQPITGLPLYDTNNNGTATAPAPGDWNSIRLDQYSNDRNVAIIMETEPSYIGTVNDPTTGRPLGDVNRVARTQAQFLGNLAPNEKSGDDNRRLGFEIQGYIALDNAHDVDVYSFTADGGTEVWFDIDRTSYGLNAVIELVDANGQMLARSTDNDTLTSSAFATALTFNKDPHLGRDFYGVNPKDASFRVLLPGVQKGVTYFIRVRSEGAPADIGNINAGLTRGEYRLQVRVRQVDNKPGSTVRYSDIRYATNGIEVIGLPYHSPITGESTESTTPNDAFTNAQYLGNLLTSDRGTIAVSGNINGSGDVDFFSFDLDYDFLQVIGGVSDAAKTISTMFDIDYADGLSRPDTTISVFNAAGQLIFMGRDSDIEDDQPGVGQGNDFDDLSRGSFGKLDPYIGSAQMPAGSVGAGLTRRYYVAISSNRRLPTALNAQFQANADSPLIRLEPVNSVRRIVEDHIGFTNGSGLAQGAGAPLFEVTNAQTLAAHINTYGLSDSTLFITPGLGLNQVDPFTGTTEVGNYGGTDQIRDITMRNDGRLFGYRNLINDPNNAGQLVEFNYDTNSWDVRGSDGIANIPNPVPNPLDFDLLTTDRVDALAYVGNGYQNNYQLFFSVAGATDIISGAQVSRLYRADPNTGNVRDGNGPLGARGNIIQDTTLTASGTASFVDPVNGFISSITFDATAAGASGNAIQLQFTKSNRGFGATPGVTVNGTIITVDLNTVASNATSNYGTSAGITFNAVPTGAAGNGIVVNITKAANVPGGVTATRVGRTVNVTMDDTNATAGQLKAAVDGAGAGLVTVNISGSPATVIGPTGSSGAFRLGGGGPSSAQDVIDAINAEPNATALVTVRSTNGNLLADATPGVPTAVQLAGGVGTISRTTGMIFLDGTLYGVSETGAFYTIAGNGAATTIRQFEPGVRFTGLTLGPQNVDNGAYADFFFATTDTGQIIVFDASGVEQPVLQGGASRVSALTGTGLAFSLNDFNLWHTTRFRGGEAGHGINPAPDNSRGGSQGGTSFYFGVEEWTNGNNTYFYHGAGTQQLGILEPDFQRNLTSNPLIGNNYNFPGGAKGSLTTDSFSLAGYKGTDKPTFYFNYWLDTEGRQSIDNGNMRDAARVWISRDDGLTWELIATNNSQLDNPGTFNIDGELPPFKSTSRTELPANARQDVQELYDTASWRQARVDLTDYAGQSNLKFRFDFATSGSTTLGTVEPNFGDESHPERGQRNNFGGFMIDDLIVGFAERGEMATGATPGLTTFFAQPTPVAPGGVVTPNEVLSGSYVLEIRRGADYGVNLDAASAAIGLYNTWDTNARLIGDIREAPPPAVRDFQTQSFGAEWAQRGDQPWSVLEDPLVPGQYRAYSGAIADAEESSLELTTTVGEGTMTFDWGVSSQLGSDFLVFYIDGVIQDAITGTVPTNSVTFAVSAGTHTFRWSYIKDGDLLSAGADRGWIDNIAFSNGPSLGAVDSFTGLGTRGDENHWRDQGHIQIEQNLITDSELIGILVDAADRSITGTNLPFTGSVLKQVTPNTDDLAPGVALVNNTIGGYGTAGIRLSGDPNVAGQPVAASPFGKVFNNTIYGGATNRGVGIQVDQNAAPTILNNIISNAVTGISVDASSNPTTVVGFNLFKGNTANGTVGTDFIVLAANEPLFVNPATRNFYLAANSRAIDASLNALFERPSYHEVITELGIPDSPILAPEFDMYGQKRLDDPGVTNPTPGQGGAIIKDRGAIERADFIGARVDLIDPLDNDLDGRDRNPALNDVVVKPSVAQFKLRLVDTGIGIDDRAVNAGQFTLTKDGVPLVLGTDYSFVYNTNTDEITFLPASGTWAENSTYVITVDNSTATGVKDLAGNLIQTNRADGGTRFVIYVGVPWDYSDAPAPYATARHDMSNSLYLGTAVTAEQAAKLPNADEDDGLVSHQLVPGQTSTITYVASGSGILDVWVDLNSDGDFTDAGEKIGAFATVVGSNTQTFTLPAANLGNTYMRMRLTTAGIASPTVDAVDGEVEDYAISLVGPPFQNPNRAPGEPLNGNPNDNARRDVNADGFITAIDALIVINHLQRLSAYNDANDPDLSAALPIPGIIDTVGTAPNARYVDVNGDGFLTAADALTVINWLQANPIGPSDGEGEGEASSLSFATTSSASDDAYSLFATDPMYASSSIVIEERTAEVDAGEVAAQLLTSDSGFQPVVHDQAWSSDELFGAYGQSEDEEDDLISILAFDVGAADGELS